MTIPIYQVDAFTDRLYTGNPAAVVFPDSELPAATMQAIAAENNLAETAFVVPDGAGYRIRWFTPVVEVDLCGHATLAAAHVIFEHLNFAGHEIVFSSKSGHLEVRKDREILYMNFPADRIRKRRPPEHMIAGLGVTPIEVYRGRDDYLAILESEDLVVSLKPDIPLLARIEGRGVIVSARGHETDFVLRFFSPQCGVPEDPVTGSAHTSLVPYWSQKLGKQSLKSKQVSQRGGDLLCRDLGERVEIGGLATTYLIGAITEPG